MPVFSEEIEIKTRRAAGFVGHPFLVAKFVEREARKLAEINLVHAKTRVLEIEGKVSGLIAMIGNEIGGLFLLPWPHGRGLGKALIYPFSDRVLVVHKPREAFVALSLRDRARIA